MTVAYKIKKGCKVFDMIWWNKYWGREAFKALDASNLFDEYDFTADDFALSGTTPLIKPNSVAYDYFKESLLKRMEKNGYFKFRKKPKDVKAKEFFVKFTEIINPFENKREPFVYTDVFGLCNSQGGLVNDDLAIIKCSNEISETSKYLDQVELISEPEFYRIKADMLEKNK